MGAVSSFRIWSQEAEQQVWDRKERKARKVGVSELLPLWTTGTQSHGKQRMGPGIFPPEDRLGHLPTILFLQWLRVASITVPVAVLLSVSVHRPGGRPGLGPVHGADEQTPRVCLLWGHQCAWSCPPQLC